MKRRNTKGAIFPALIMAMAWPCGLPRQALAAAGQKAIFGASPFLGLYDANLSEEWLTESLKMAYIRVPAAWHEVERKRGKYDWDELDQRIGLASRASERVQISIQMTWPEGKKAPYALEPATRMPAGGEGAAALRRFFEQIVMRYRDIAVAYGAGEDLSRGGFSGDADVYAAALRALSDAVRAGDSGAAVVFGATAFDTMDEDGRVFYVADVLNRLGSGGSVFDAIELRVVGLDAREDFRRVTAAVRHLRGQISQTAYRNAPIALISASPASSSAGGQSEQAADLVRRTLSASEAGAAKLCWAGGLTASAPGAGLARVESSILRSGLASKSSDGRSVSERQVYYTAQLLNRINQRYNLAKVKIAKHPGHVYEARIDGGPKKDLLVVWRNYFDADQSYSSGYSLELKKLGIEGPGREGLNVLRMVSRSNGYFAAEPVPGKYFNLDGSPVIFSQDVDMLYDISY